MRLRHAYQGRFDVGCAPLLDRKRLGERRRCSVWIRDHDVTLAGERFREAKSDVEKSAAGPDVQIAPHNGGLAAAIERRGRTGVKACAKDLGTDRSSVPGGVRNHR
jgi:hypothetical protein